MPAKNLQPVTVKRGNSHLTVYPWTHPATGAQRWRFAWRAAVANPWRYETHRTKQAAVDAADVRLASIESGHVHWESLSPQRRRFLESVHTLTSAADEQHVLAYLSSRGKAAEIVSAIAEFLAHKRASKSVETRHLGNLRRILEPFGLAFAGRSIADIGDADVLAWWRARTKDRSGKTGNEIRAALVAFYRWAVMARMIPKDTTPADRLPRSEAAKHARRVLTPDELLKTLAAVKRDWRAWVVLGAFCGIRPEEIAPATIKGAKTRAEKRGLRCEEIDWQFNVIRVPDEVSKVGHPRNVPLCDAAREWLLWAGIEPGMSGAVCLRNPSMRPFETARLGREVFGGVWPQDALRHSFGSYRNAQLRNLDQVAEEMGTSVAMLKRHYHNPRTIEEGEAWFALRPADLEAERERARA
jgi:integrase